MKKTKITLLIFLGIYLSFIGCSSTQNKQQEITQSQQPTKYEISDQVTLVLYRSNLESVIIYSNKSGNVRISAGYLNDVMHYKWSHLTFLCSNFDIVDEYQLDSCEIEELNRLLSDKNSIKHINPNEIKGGLEYYIYLNGILCYKQPDLPQVVTREIPELRITKTPRGIINMLTKHIDNYFIFDTE